MKKKAKNLIDIFGFLIIFLLLGTMFFSVTNSSAIIERENTQCTIDSSDYSTWQWSDTQVLSTESSDLSMYTTIAFDLQGNAHVAWEDDTIYDSSGADRDIFYKRWDLSTETWSTTEVVSTESTDDSVDPTIGVDSAGSVHIAWVDYTDGGSGSDRDIFYKRHETASSWSSTEVVSSGLDGMAENPSLAVDENDNVHVAWEDNTNNYGGSGIDFDIFYRKMSGITNLWSTTEVVSTESTEMSAVCSIDIDVLNNVHIAWADGTDLYGAGSGFDIFYKNKNSFTTLWSTTEVVSTESDGVSVIPDIAMDSHGNVHIVWQDVSDFGETGSGYDIFYKKWDIYTSLWSTTMVLSPGSTGESQEAKIVVDAEDNLHLTWYDGSNQLGAGIDNDIFYRNWNAFSDDWSSIKLISTTSTNHSTAPSLAVNNAGYVFLTWHDLTDFPGIGDDRDIFMKYFASVPDAPVLAYFEPNPTEADSVSINWNDVEGAVQYHVYRLTSFIFSIDGLNPIYSTIDNGYNDLLMNVGYHYYAIVAENFVGNSTISNCEFVLYKLPSLNEFVIISGWIFTAVVIVFALVQKRRKRSK